MTNVVITDVFLFIGETRRGFVFCSTAPVVASR